VAETSFICTTESDAMHELLMRRADVLADCAGASLEDVEFKAFVDVLETYET